jgi:hypothetical protein
LGSVVKLFKMHRCASRRLPWTSGTWRWVWRKSYSCARSSAWSRESSLSHWDWSVWGNSFSFLCCALSFLASFRWPTGLFRKSGVDGGQPCNGTATSIFAAMGCAVSSRVNLYSVWKKLVREF